MTIFTFTLIFEVLSAGFAILVLKRILAHVIENRGLYVFSVKAHLLFYLFSYFLAITALAFLSLTFAINFL